MITEQEILNTLKHVQDPDLNQNIVDLGFVRNIKIESNSVELEVCLTTPLCPVKDDLKSQVEERIQQLGVGKVTAHMTSEVRKAKSVNERREIKGVKNIVVIGSGKGGVGKSTIATNIACGFAQMGAKVGLLDADIYGPSVPFLMKTHEKVYVIENRMQPIPAHCVKLMSMGFLVEGDKPLIWRGPMAHRALDQCLFEVDWGELDYLFVDLPPGTGDIHLTLSQSVNITGAVIVSTPQDVGLVISRKTLRMFETTHVPILGLIENMSSYLCPHCGEEDAIFGSGTVESVAKQLGIAYLGSIPLHKEIRTSGDEGKPAILQEKLDNTIKARYNNIISFIARQVSIMQYR